eukprot:6174516-Prymnesium_polylepis.2
MEEGRPRQLCARSGEEARRLRAPYACAAARGRGPAHPRARALPSRPHASRAAASRPAPQVEQLRSELLKAREASVTAQGGGLLSYMQSLGRENVAELTSSISQEVHLPYLGWAHLPY